MLTESLNESLPASRIKLGLRPPGMPHKKAANQTLLGAASCICKRSCHNVRAWYMSMSR